MARKLDNFKLRARFLCFIFFVLGGLLTGRLFFIQVSGHDFYLARAENQINSYKLRASISIRGDIYFKEKDSILISAATTKDGYLAALNPSLIKDPEFACRKAVELLNVENEDCLNRASKENDPFEIIAHRLNDAAAGTIWNLNFDGLSVFPEQWRFYPGNFLASQVLGFVGYKGDQLVGRYGLEEHYEDILKGKKESLKKSDSFAMLFFELSKDFLGTDAASGHDIILTIEPRVQSLLESSLDNLMKDWSALEAGGIIMNPRTGEVIAMASKPSFNPNIYNEVEDISYFKNPLVSSIFELGSVFKPLTLAAAIDVGKINAQTTYVDNGYVIFNNQRIENYDGEARGLVDMQTVLNKSLNTGAVFVMRQLGKEKFLEYFKNYGLAEKTGIDLPDEEEGHMSNLLSMRDVEFATASFGQGVAVTPIEFTAAISSLANGGLLVEPHVVDKIIVEGGKDYEAQPVVKRRVLKEQTSKEITRMLVNVVDEALLNGTVKMDRYSIAAKTGTALLPKGYEEGYYEDDYLHSFFGYGPAFDAKFLIFLYLKRPQGVRYASQTLTDPFIKLMKFLFTYYEIPPDR